MLIDTAHPDGKPARVWTYDDLEALPDDGNRYEILDGRLLVSPSPVLAHQHAVTCLVALLFDALQRRRLATVFPAPCDVKLSATRVVEPDLVVVRATNASVLTQRCIVGVPDLVIEVLSPSTEHVDRGEKQALYGEVRVPEYWIVDPEARTLEVLAPDDGGVMRLLATYRADDVARSRLFPELVLPMRDVFPD